MLTLTGAISGPGTLCSRRTPGTLQLDNTGNDYAGSTHIHGNGATLRLGTSEVVPDGSSVYVNAGGTFNLNNFNETIGSLEGSGLVTLDNGTLTTGGNNSSTTFSGTINGSGGGLIKQGFGTMTITAANNHIDSVNTTISRGTLRLGNNEPYRQFGGRSQRRRQRSDLNASLKLSGLWLVLAMSHSAAAT